MKEKKKLVISILGVILLVIAVVGISYAAFNYSKQGQTVNSITTSTIVMNYTEKENGIRLVDAVPMEDVNGKVLTGAGNVFDFTVSANISGEVTINYAITGSKVEGTTLPDSAVKVWLTSADDAIIELDGVSSLTDDAKKISELRLTNSDASGAPNNQYILKTGVITASEVTNYRLRMWIASDYSLKQDVVETYKLRVNVYGKEYVPEPTAVNKLLANYTNDEETQDYDLGYTKEDVSVKENKMYVFDHKDNKGIQQSDWTDNELIDYRYIGKDPNNYVTFNNEEAGWRIIGIETVDDGTGKREQRIKLIRKDFLPVGEDNYLSWDNKPEGTGSSESDWGSNDWYDSRLMYLLNPNYEEEQTGVSGSIYWNRQNGNCPKASFPTSNQTTPCDFSEVGLLLEAQKMIGDAKWYLGGIGSIELTETHYKSERSETVYQSENYPRKTNWTGKVGLMYPSDYGYATSGGATANRETCLAKELYNWDSKDNGIPDCKNNDWLYNSNEHQWTITPFFDNWYDVFAVSPNGFGRGCSVYTARGVRPVVYLVSNIKLLKGTGSQSDPFEFGL